MITEVPRGSKIAESGPKRFFSPTFRPKSWPQHRPYTQKRSYSRPVGAGRATWACPGLHLNGTTYREQLTPSFAPALSVGVGLDGPKRTIAVGAVGAFERDMVPSLTSGRGRRRGRGLASLCESFTAFAHGHAAMKPHPAVGAGHERGRLPTCRVQ